jgi:ABC-type transporter Mla MlaB component
MSLQVAHYPEEDRLDLTIEGNLDLTLTSQVLKACELIDDALVVCVIDATRVTRVFDSGLAVLMLLASRLAQFRARLIIIGNIAGLRGDTLPLPLRRAVGMSGFPS